MKRSLNYFVSINRRNRRALLFSCGVTFMTLLDVSVGKYHPQLLQSAQKCNPVCAKGKKVFLEIEAEKTSMSLFMFNCLKAVVKL